MPDRSPVVATAARSTVAGIAPTRLKIDMRDLYKLETEEGALMTTMALLSKERANAKTVYWHTSELRPKFMRVNAGTLTDATLTITVDANMGTYVAPGFLIKVTRTGETMMVASSTDTTVTVTARSWGATPAAALADNDEILIMGPAYAENASLNAPRTVTETQYSNNVQTMRHNWAMSGLLQEISNNGGTYGGKDPANQRQDMLLTHKRDINLTLLHGEGAVSSGTASAHGIIPWLVANAPNNVNGATTITESVFEAGNKTWFRYGKSRTRLLLVSQSWAGGINEWAKNVIQTKSGDNTYGLEVTTYQGRFGKLKTIIEYGLEGDEYSKYALGIDPKGLSFNYVRDTQMLKNRQGTSVDGYEEEVLTDFTGVYGQPENCYLWNAAAW